MVYSEKTINFFVLDITLKGGIERFSINMANAFVNKGMKVVIYSLHKTNDCPLYNVDERVTVIYLFTFPFRNRFYKLSTFLSCVRLRFISFKLNAPGMSNISTHPITTIYLRFLGFNMASIIASEHSTYNSHSRLISYLRRWAYSEVKEIITQTKSGNKSFSEVGLKTTTIYNSTVNFDDASQWSINSNQDFVCLTVARIEPVKNLEVFLKIAKKIKETGIRIRFVIVGDGSHKSYLQNKSNEMGLASIVEFHSATNEVNKFYKEASLYLITSKSESFSMTMTEALSFSVPVLSNKSLVGPFEVISHGYDGFLCNDNDVEEFAKCILEAYKPETLIELRNGALSTAKKFYEEAIIDEWLKVL